MTRCEKPFLGLLLPRLEASKPELKAYIGEGEILITQADFIRGPIDTVSA